jgi:hypothetical protein
MLIEIETNRLAKSLSTESQCICNHATGLFHRQSPAL